MGKNSKKFPTKPTSIPLTPTLSKGTIQKIIILSKQTFNFCLKYRQMENSKIAKTFKEIGNLLEIDEVNHFRVLAYRNAAEIIKSYGREMEAIYNQDPKKLKEIPGIGPDLQSKIEELIKTDKCQYHQRLLQKYGQGIIDIFSVRGLGPKKVKLFYQKLKIDNLKKLKKAARTGEISKLPHMGKKSEQEILKALEEKQKLNHRLLLSEALPIAEEIVTYLKKLPQIFKVQYAGSLRRGKETIGDLDILGTPKKSCDNKKIITYFQQFPKIENIIASGPTKSSVILQNGIQIDLRIVNQKSWGAALHYFTGSKEHNIAMRDIAKKQGYKINEYGVYKLGTTTKKNIKPKEIYVAGRTEKAVYNYFKLPYIPPPLRENRGELAAATIHKLPKLIELKDIQGSLHNHSIWSDGISSIEEMTATSLKAGYKYLAMTDHSKGLGIANGLTKKRFIEQWKEIDALNKKFTGKITILKGIECDIRHDGQMDFENNFLRNFDIVIASIHGSFHLEEKIQTNRVIKALENPYINILGHPTGRLLNERLPYTINLEKVISTAAKFNKIIEINSQPSRLDLPDNYIKTAIENNIKLAINSDAHHISQINYLQFGILTAQRGWAETKDIINTISLKKLLKYLQQKY